MNEIERDREYRMQRVAGELVAEHVYCNVGGLVTRLQELAGVEELDDFYQPNGADYQQALEGYGAVDSSDEDFYYLVEQDGTRRELSACDEDEALREACEFLGCEPEVEIYEWYTVSGWLKDRLAEKGHHVGDLYGLNVWGRETTGQAIKLDNAIREIVAETPRYAERLEQAAA